MTAAVTTVDRTRGRPTGVPRPLTVVRLLVRLLVTLLLVSLIVFSVTQVLPGDVARIIGGQQATAEQIERIRENLGLDRPAWAQYLSWLGGIFTGDLGVSLASGDPVLQKISGRVLNSVTLVVITTVISVPLAVFLGTIAARSRGRISEWVFQSVVVLVNALPMFVLGTLLVILFATTVFPILPAVSNIRPGRFPWEEPVLLILPVATLVLLAGTYIASIVRTTVIDALASEYVMLAELKGLSESRVLFRHALSNAIGPVLQAVSIAAAITFGSVVIIEYVFAYPGVGTGLTEAIALRDIPVLQAYVLLIAAVFFIGNFIADVISDQVGERKR